MPAHLLAAAVAPKAGALAAAAAASVGADVVGAEDSSDALLTHHVAATSFLRLPKLPRLSKLRHHMFNAIVGPEIRAYHWLQGQLGGMWHKLFDGGVVSPDQARMVEYYAAGCPHCKTLAPSWKKASEIWAGRPEANYVEWQQKQCLDEKWKPGKDFEECQAQHISGFPTIKFFPPGHQTGDEFFFSRTPERLVEFARTGLEPDEASLPRLEGDESDLKLVDFYSAGCPHCKALDPIWTKAEKQWDAATSHREDAPEVSFVKKECYDAHWNPGKDHAECEKFNVQAFPTIKLFTPARSGHGFAPGADYAEARTPEAINSFLKKEAGLQPEILKALQPEAAGSHADKVDTLAAPPAPSKLVRHVPEEEPRGPEALAAAAAAPASAAAKKVPVAPVIANVPTAKEVVLAAKKVDVPDALKQAVKVAFAPLPILSCLPVDQRARASECHAQPRRGEPPVAVGEFL